MTAPAPLLSNVLVPIANEADAATTMDALLERLAAADGRLTALHVVEKAGGAPDKVSVAQREAAAEDAFAVVTARAAVAGVPVETRLGYGTDVAETIREVAAEVDASAIVFTPRGGSVLVDLVTGDVARSLVKAADRPVVVLPAPAGNDDARGGE